MVKVMLIMVSLTALFVLAPGIPVMGTPESKYEVWESSYLFSRIIAYVNQKENELSGVVYILGPFGKKDTYHFTGFVRKGRIEALHHSGHKFKGKVLSNEQVIGVITSKTGNRYKIKVQRRKK